METIATVGDDVNLSNLVVIALSDQGKQRLLTLADANTQLANPSGESLLTNLKKFYPQAHDHFTTKLPSQYYAPLRLLCESQCCESQLADTYITLSYCWHNDDWHSHKPFAERNEDGKTYPISVRLLRHILGLRVSKCEGLWIDQCCIQQDDPEEKQQAVGSMDVIYTTTRLVVIVLEDVLLDENEEELLSYLLSLGEELTDNILNVADGIILQNVMYNVCKARWFTRAWCTHELQLSTDSVMLVPGVNSIIEMTPGQLCDLWNVMHYGNDAAENPETEIDMERMKVIESAWSMIAQKDDFSTTEPNIGFTKAYRSMFNDILNLSCFVQADKISIGLNVSGLPLKYIGGAKTNGSVRWTLTMLALAAGDASTLSGLDSYILDDSQPHEEPWLQVNQGTVSTHPGAPALISPDDITRFGSGQMTTDLICLIEPKTHLPSVDALQRSRELIKICTSRPAAKELFELHSISLGDVGMETRQNLLACSVDCGVQWMAEQAAACPDYNTTSNWKNLVNSNCGFEFHIYMGKCLFDEEIEAMDEQTQSIVYELLCKFVYIILHESCFEDTFRIEQYILRSSSHDKACSGLQSSRQYSNVPKCAWIDLGSGRKALIHALDPSKCLGESKLQFAVPKPLIGPQCARERRLWLLEWSQSPHGHWHILTKFPLLSHVPITVDGEKIIESLEQTIQGRRGSLMSCGSRLERHLQETIDNWNLQDSMLEGNIQGIKHFTAKVKRTRTGTLKAADAEGMLRAARNDVRNTIIIHRGIRSARARIQQTVSDVSNIRRLTTEEEELLRRVRQVLKK